MKLCIHGVAFEANGTLFDVHLVIAMHRRFLRGKGAERMRLLRTKQLVCKCNTLSCLA
jgi:hypothetical protein